MIEHTVNVHRLGLARSAGSQLEQLSEQLRQPIYLAQHEVDVLLGDGRGPMSAASNCIAPRIPPSGLRISCARPATTTPSCARLFARCTSVSKTTLQREIAKDEGGSTDDGGSDSFFVDF